MDLRGMINDSEQVLHRGSVDKTGTRKPQFQPPVYSHVFRGRRNAVRDPRRWKLAETRPELAELFQDDGTAVVVDDATSAHKVGGGGDEEAYTHPTTTHSEPRVAHIGAVPAEIGPGGNVSLTGLPASLALLVPGDDQTKVLAGQIYERLDGVAPEILARGVEIEFKFGLIADERLPRHKFPVMSEAVVDPIYWRQERLRFRSDVQLSHFKQLETLLDSLALASSGSETHAIRRLNLLSRDASYSVTLPGDDSPTRVRISFNERDEVVECINKKRLLDLYISQPNCAYDLKMSLSTETNIDFAQIRAQVAGLSPQFERNKNRLEWRTPGCQVDLTSVHSTGVTKEVEVECNTELLGATLADARANKPQALDAYLEAVRYTMDSARFLVRNL